MSYALSDFEGQLKLTVAAWPSYASSDAELNAIRIALGADATTRDATIQRAPASVLQPGNRLNSPFTNAIAKLINRGKGGNLSTIQMANIIGSISTAPPQNTVAPQITYVSGGSGAGTVGASYANSFGTWVPPTGQLTMTRQWMRGATPIAGATGASYTVVVADAGNSILCAVTGTNASGSTTANSNSAGITLFGRE